MWLESATILIRTWSPRTVKMVCSSSGNLKHQTNIFYFDMDRAYFFVHILFFFLSASFKTWTFLFRSSLLFRLCSFFLCVCVTGDNSLYYSCIFSFPIKHLSQFFFKLFVPSVQLNIVSCFPNMPFCFLSNPYTVHWTQSQELKQKCKLITQEYILQTYDLNSIGLWFLEGEAFLRTWFSCLV